MSIGNLIVVVNSAMVSCLIRCYSLLQNASGFQHKMRWLLQIVTILLQNVTVITK